jgi:circadian clock protein KaiC
VTRNDIAPLTFETTGDAGLDRILGGGIPTRSVVVVAGEPGSGKTILTLQLLFAAARRGEKCVYFTTVSEPAIKLIRYMQLFEFFDLELLHERVVFVDLGDALQEGADRVTDEIARRVDEIEPAFIAVDSFRAITELLRERGDARRFVYDLSVQMAGWGTTALLVGEYTPREYARFPEFAVADGIFRLGSERQELTSVRAMEVSKLRGAPYSSGQHFYDISPAGLTIYPRVSAPAEPQAGRAPTARARTGIEGLDELLGGGIPRNTSTIVQGGTGTGKTLLSLQFLVEGAARGEKGVLFTLEETPDQLRSIAATLGWDLAALEREGRLVIQYDSPVELSTDRYLHEARNVVREVGARRAVFDSLTTMRLGVASERRYKEMIYAIAKHMRAAEVSLFLTVESEQLLGSAVLTGHGVSFIADNLIQLRYVEIGGRLERAISVLKARGIQHDSELRSVTIGAGGLQVLKDRFRDMRGVLTGLPERETREPA